MKSKNFECKKSGAIIEVRHGDKIALVGFTGRIGIDLESARGFQKTLAKAIEFAGEKTDPNVQALKKSNVKLFVVKWEERDSWSGPSDAGLSLHEDEQSYKKFLRIYTVGRTGPTPECYDIPANSGKHMEVSNIVLEKFKETTAPKNVFGYRTYCNSLKSLEKFLLKEK